jgi:arylsulfatase
MWLTVMNYLKEKGLDNNTIIVFTTDNGTDNFTWPDGGQTPFYGGKGTGFEGGWRVPAILSWPGHVPTGKVQNGLMSGLDWFPTFLAAAGTNIMAELVKGKEVNGTNYKVHLDGYDQTNMITGKGPSNRHEIYYFTETSLAAMRIDDFKYRFSNQPTGWLGVTEHPDVPTITNLRLDPFERTGWWAGNNGSFQYWDWFKFEFWRFVLVQQEIAKAVPTFLEFPPMQKGASFNLEALKAEMAAKQALIQAAQAAAGK